ncbi:tRNA (adenine(37)-N6)-methyltransferase isoform X2 [Rhinatrema bivittatum]|uniref:tRNA (adenine(37)-N6)-methyltransferase isoform X2 n=1 Tax=Rhinatrema bivittatum TaxID=194408 RepID=UPI001128D8FD|nr:tRNA (adenine(37)-N6)-methyltransferase isoform X2 [Rhinatrema bivittatum]
MSFATLANWKPGGLGNIVTIPIGYIDSCFSAKNGTPRQPTVCRMSRARLTINKSVFNNPEHSLIGLEHFSHVWILFVFHKNGHLSCKAKVQPPRLNGAKTGIFSTRSPHRPNAIGLTLAKLEKIEGGTLHLSGIDMIQGTPVLDIKPYISDYDSPQNAELSADMCNEQGGRCESECSPESVDMADNGDMPNVLHSGRPRPHQNQKEVFPDPDCQALESDQKKHLSYEDSNKTKLGKSEYSAPRMDISPVATDGQRLHPLVVADTHMSQDTAQATVGERSRAIQNEQHSEFQLLQQEEHLSSSVPSWVRDSPVATLRVRFTAHSEMEIRQFKAAGSTATLKMFRYFRSPEEMKHAITTVLAADPRSVYRRKQCQDRLFYFTLDMVHVTCWFGEGFAEVLRVKPVEASQYTDNGV